MQKGGKIVSKPKIRLKADGSYEISDITKMSVVDRKNTPEKAKLPF